MRPKYLSGSTQCRHPWNSIHSIHRSRTGNPASERKLHFSQVKNLEVLSGYRIFIALPEKAHVVRVFQLFDPHWVAPELLYVAADRAGILHTAMNQLFFPIPLDLECDARRNRGGCNGEHGYEQHQHEQNVSLLIAALHPGWNSRMHVGRGTFYPWVSGILCRLLFSTSSTSTAIGEMRRTL